MYSYFDIVIVLSNAVLLISLAIVSSYSQKLDKMDEETFKWIMIMQNDISVIGTIAVFMKATYFLSLIDQIAPLIDAVF
jgi:hypothetical protein